MGVNQKEKMIGTMGIHVGDPLTHVKFGRCYLVSTHHEILSG